MDDMKLLSTEAEGVNEAVPEEHRRNLVNSSGRVGALLGLLDTSPQDEPEMPGMIAKPGSPEGCHLYGAQQSS